MKNPALPLTRRRWLQAAGCGFGSLAFHALAADAEDETHDGAPGRPSQFDPDLKLQHAPRAKRVIFLFMDGGPSQLDSFDYKPAIKKNAKKKTRGSAIMRSPFAFAPHGESGLYISSAFPELAKLADDLCLLNGMETDSSSHSSATQAYFTGNSRLEVPSLGAWSVYGLGDGGRVLPGFVSINASGSSKNYGHGFLPASYQGVQLEIGENKRQFFREVKASGAPNLASGHYSELGQRRQIEFVQRMNRQFAADLGGDDRVEAVIQSFENGFSMRSTLRELLKPESEPDEVQKLYGLDKPETKEFARQCLVARRMVEDGVRFIQLNSPKNSWDHHSDLKSRFARSARGIDRPIAGLLIDLKRRGLLGDTLVVWGGEFGRPPTGNNGRGHQNRGFTTWVAGGGVRGGMRYGATDEIGGKIAEGAVHMRDLHATILHQLGFDPSSLKFSRDNRDYFSEAKDGRVVREILA